MSLIPRDKKVIWHPFRQEREEPNLLHITRGKGAYLYDEKGKRYLDAFSSWWVNLHGHANPYIAKKIYNQAQTLEQAAFSSYTHEPAVTLAERLLKHLSGQAKVFYSDNGSTAVEVALKMAIQYHHNLGRKVKQVISFANSYHGDTFGSMSVAERNVFNLPFSPFLFDVIQIPVPVRSREKESLTALKKALKGNGASVFIFEPLVQGAGGMVMYEPKALNQLLKECRKNNCTTIADEVMTGFGRTGRFFACDHLSEKPDIVCLSKGITGGFMPLGATTCTSKIYSAFISDDRSKTFYHGHSYTANPLACSASIASLDLLEKKETWKRIGMISVFFDKMKKRFESHPAVVDCRSLGTVFAVEIKTLRQTSYLNPIAKQITAFFLERGIMVRPLGNILYFLPPYCVTEHDLNQLYKTTNQFLDTFGKPGTTRKQQ